VEHKADDQFLTIPEPGIPWKEVVLANFESRRLAQGTVLRHERNVYLETYDFKFSVSGELMLLLSRTELREHMLDLYLDAMRSGLVELINRERLDVNPGPGDHKA
jgi:hypothetical protein